ncbi:DUF2500 domain-containing protein [Paenibacillus sp. CC-CFT747]|nr:DUF2500 domain-containing protein [Paenibacillus sp. CC-CFT747]
MMTNPGFGGGGISHALFSLFPIIFGTVFVLVIGTILVKSVKGVAQWSSNNQAERRKEWARVVTKRTQVYGGSGDTSASTDYYVTFELPDRSRLEMKLRGAEYGLLAEGDTGTLDYQGTRFHAFQRD